MLKIFINFYCNIHWSAEENDTTCKNLDSSMQCLVLKINVAKIRFFWCISEVKGTLKKIHSPGNLLLIQPNVSKNPLISL